MGQYLYIESVFGTGFVYITCLLRDIHFLLNDQNNSS